MATKRGSPKATRLVAKVTAKGQTTIPKKVREMLRVRTGDLLLWEIQPGGTASVRRVQPLDVDYLHALEMTLSEWAGPADEEAYRDLRLIRRGPRAVPVHGS